MYTVIDLFDMHKQPEDIEEESCHSYAVPDCFMHSIMTLSDMKGPFILCYRCPLFCFIKQDELAADLEVDRSAAELEITPEELRARRAASAPTWGGRGG